MNTVKNVIILGASGNIASHVIDLLAKKDDIKLTLFVRNKRRLGNKHIANSQMIEASDLDYTILRPTWFSNEDEIDYETTRKGEPERGSVISQKSLAALIANIIESPEQYARQNLGVNKPNS